MIGKSDWVGLILQKEAVGPVYFYHRNVYNIYSKYRVLPPEIAGETYELRHLEDIVDEDGVNHHYKWLCDNTTNLKTAPCQDMRLYNNTFVNTLEVVGND